jgi:hypothetical protein
MKAGDGAQGSGKGVGMKIGKRHAASACILAMLILATGACGTLRPNATDPGGFSLIYVSEGSESPAKSELRIHSSGEFRYTRDSLEPYPSTMDGGVDLSGTLSKEDFDVTIAMLVDELKFFQLPAARQGDEPPMGASVETVTLSYKGQTRSIKDYAAAPIGEYSLLTSFLKDFVQRILDHAEGRRTSASIHLSH